ncbi:MAG: dodecin family protein [Clostridia bacterium]|jgi:hypothetical protein
MQVEKHLYVTATSDVSWKDAITKAISEASKTIDYLSNVKVLEQRATIERDKLSVYYVDLDISFIVDPNREQ